MPRSWMSFLTFALVYLGLAVVVALVFHGQMRAAEREA